MSVAKRILGWPLRAALNQRIRWINAHVDARAHELHLRLDEIRAMVSESRDQVSLERRASDEGIAAVLETLRFIEERVPSLQPKATAAQPGDINERIVEVPFVFSAVGSVPTPSRLLDLCGSESTVALSLASMGHQVTVVDPRGCRFVHPNLRAIECRFDDLHEEVSDFDAAVALSSIEHLGIGHSVPRVEGHERSDMEAVNRLRERVRPGGLLVLTVPFGEPSVDDFQRVYDLAGVHELLAEWTEVELQAAWNTGPNQWTIGSPEEPMGSRGVALVIARNDRR